MQPLGFAGGTGPADREIGFGSRCTRRNHCHFDKQTIAKLAAKIRTICQTTAIDGDIGISNRLGAQLPKGSRWPAS